MRDPIDKLKDLSVSVQEAIDKLCESTAIDEISLEVWENHQKSYDLTVPLFLTLTDIARGGVFEVRYSRFEVPDLSTSRQQRVVKVEVKIGSRFGSRIAITGGGEAGPEGYGMLYVSLVQKG